MRRSQTIQRGAHLVLTHTPGTLTLSHHKRGHSPPLYQDPSIKVHVYPPIASTYAPEYGDDRSNLFSELFRLVCAILAVAFPATLIYLEVHLSDHLNDFEGAYRWVLIAIELGWAVYFFVLVRAVRMAPFSRRSHITFQNRDMLLSLHRGALSIGKREIPLTNIRCFRRTTACTVRRDLDDINVKGYTLDFGVEVVSVGPPLVFGFIAEEHACDEVVAQLNAFLQEFRESSTGMIQPPKILSSYAYEGSAVTVAHDMALLESPPGETGFKVSEGEERVVFLRAQRFLLRVVVFFVVGSLQWLITFPTITFLSTEWKWDATGCVIIALVSVFWLVPLVVVIPLWLNAEKLRFGHSQIVHRRRWRIPGFRSRYNIRAIDRVEIFSESVEAVPSMARRKMNETDVLGGERFGIRLWSGVHLIAAVDKLTEGDAMFMCAKLRQRYPSMFPATSETLDTTVPCEI